MSVIETERLLLRQLNWEDAAFILELVNETDFVRFIGDKGVRTLADARDYISQGPLDSYARHGFGLYMTATREGIPVGICGLVKREGLADPDIGYAFLKRHRARGYAAESAAAVLSYGKRELRLARIVAICQADNERSIAVLEKIGLKFERMIRLAQHDTDVRLYSPRGETGA
jgi:RimJ/RimL family protein N-acetyltransferase